MKAVGVYPLKEYAKNKMVGVIKCLTTITALQTYYRLNIFIFKNIFVCVFEIYYILNTQYKKVIILSCILRLLLVQTLDIAMFFKKYCNTNALPFEYKMNIYLNIN